MNKAEPKGEMFFMFKYRYCETKLFSFAAARKIRVFLSTPKEFSFKLLIRSMNTIAAAVNIM